MKFRTTIVSVGIFGGVLSCDSRMVTPQHAPKNATTHKTVISGSGYCHALIATATDATRTTRERRIAFFNFFDECVEVGDTLDALMERSGGLSWLPADGFYYLRSHSGPLPVEFGNGAVIAIRPELGDYSTVYIRMDGAVTQTELNILLRGTNAKSEIGSRRIIEMAIWMPDPTDQGEVRHPHKP